VLSQIAFGVHRPVSGPGKFGLQNIAENRITIDHLSERGANPDTS